MHYALFMHLAHPIKQFFDNLFHLDQVKALIFEEARKSLLQRLEHHIKRIFSLKHPI